MFSNKDYHVSVAMCTYRGHKYIYQQLQSILNQTRFPDEIIIVDDASDDATIEIINSIKSSCSLNIQLFVNSKNLGVTKNFEKAISLCSGNIIFLADQDDIWLPDKISEHLKVYDKNPGCGYVFSDAELISDEVITKAKSLWSAIGFNDFRYKLYSTKEQLSTMLNGGNFVYGTTMSFRSKYRNIILPIGSKSKGCTHDVWISILLSAASANGIGIQEPLVQYRQHTNQEAGAGRQQSVFQKLQHIYKPRRQFFIEQSLDLNNLADRLGENSEIITNNKILIYECAKHLNARAEIFTASVFKRLKIVYFELKSGRYKRFSSGLHSALRDVLSAQFFANVR